MAGPRSGICATQVESLMRSVLADEVVRHAGEIEAQLLALLVTPEELLPGCVWK
jgi:hypothetical protein